ASAGNRKSTQLAKVRRRGMAGGRVDDTIAGRLDGDPQLMFAEWSIDPHTDRCDPSRSEHDEFYTVDSYAKANPAFPHRITLTPIERERRMFDDDEAFARERLGVGTYPASDDAWDVIPELWWSDTMADLAGRLTAPALAIDTTPDRAFTAIGLAGALA